MLLKHWGAAQCNISDYVCHEIGTNSHKRCYCLWVTLCRQTVSLQCRRTFISRGLMLTMTDIRRSDKPNRIMTDFQTLRHTHAHTHINLYLFYLFIHLFIQSFYCHLRRKNQWNSSGTDQWNSSGTNQWNSSGTDQWNSSGTDPIM